MRKEVLSVILGGGRGTRLFPLTKERCKPAVPLFGKYRLIDIPVSNCLNSDFNRMYILTQFLSESLNKHINRTYKMDAFSKGFIDVMAAEQSMEDTNWFQGTADAVRRCLKHFNDPAIKYIFILSGDQLYKMDLMKMYQFHLDKGADLTVACNYARPGDVKELGIMGIDDMHRITRFVEKPKDMGLVDGMALKYKGEERYLGSMGIYLFRKEALIELLSEQNKVDFGKEIIPDAIRKKKTCAYLFDGYWRDIGTIKNFYEENLSLTSQMPPIDMFDERWQIYTRARHLPPAKIQDSRIDSSIVAEGAIVLSSAIKNSIIGLRQRVGEGTAVENSIAMGCDYYETVDEMREDASRDIPSLGIGKDCEIKGAIIDKNVRIGDGVKITNAEGVEDRDGENYYIREGIIIINKGAVIPSGTVI
ncbi:MAG: glucose-1-phosphate adenylyltransferase [Candidatus Omnitrophica bacterium]|nr:glucose-1-phosphate adenylyltransferase [Candidatus Omnitrophota bacterium]